MSDKDYLEAVAKEDFGRFSRLRLEEVQDRLFGVLCDRASTTEMKDLAWELLARARKASDAKMVEMSKGWKK